MQCLYFWFLNGWTKTAMCWEEHLVVIKNDTSSYFAPQAQREDYIHAIFALLVVWHCWSLKLRLIGRWLWWHWGWGSLNLSGMQSLGTSLTSGQPLLWRVLRPPRPCPRSIDYNTNTRWPFLTHFFMSTDPHYWLTVEAWCPVCAIPSNCFETRFAFFTGRITNCYAMLHPAVVWYPIWPPNWHFQNYLQPVTIFTF